MSHQQFANSLDVLANRLSTEIENVYARISANPDPKSLRDSINTQLESLKYGLRYEIEAIKGEILGDTEIFNVNNDKDEEIKRLQEELGKAKDLIRIHQLTGSITERVEEIFKLK